ncbi:MAG: glycogen synthase GlgA [Pusillimonas sp.]
MALKILTVTAEAFPLAKTGGLGDAVSGLGQSLAAMPGLQLSLMLPAYPGTLETVRYLRRVAVLTDMPGGDAVLLAGECPELGLPVLLLQNDALYRRVGLYVAADGSEHKDNAVRFAALAHAAVRVARGIESVLRPNIVHCHDWHAGLVPLLIRQQGVQEVKTVLTLHNVAFQGVFPGQRAAALGIAERYCADRGEEAAGCLNFLEAGIRHADLITVVSHNYAREILTPVFGCGLEGALRARARDMVAIPNGIDTRLWNPQCDPYLGGNAFSAEQPGNKKQCKRELQRSFGLREDDAAVLMAMGSRLTTQKMADVAADAIPLALRAHPALQVCIMGQGDKLLERRLATLAQAYPGRCGVHIGFDEARAHQLHAGADMLLHGSRFEPFGLTPIYAMRYGAIPIGSRLGGMADTIIDPGAQQPAAAMRAGSGILFDGDRAQDMVRAISRALSLHAQPDIWRAMRRNAMRADFDWAGTAPMYVRAYQALRPDVALNCIPERRRVSPARAWHLGLLDVGHAASRPGLGTGKMRRTLDSGPGARFV